MPKVLPLRLLLNEMRLQPSLLHRRGREPNGQEALPASQRWPRLRHGVCDRRHQVDGRGRPDVRVQRGVRGDRFQGGDVAGGLAVEAIRGRS